MERCCGAPVFHLLVIEGNLWFDFQDQIRCGIPQLPDVLVDVVFNPQPHVVIHVPAHRGGGKEGVEKKPKKPNENWMLRLHFLKTNLKVKTETREVISRMAQI